MTSEQSPQSSKPAAKSSTPKPVVVALLLLFSGFTFVVGTCVGSSITGVADSASAESQAAKEVWTCSMHPEVRMPGPGKCPKCSMDLILAEAPEVKEKPVKNVKYACSMFCLPPMDKPGKCPVCGMDMVAVEDDGAGDDDASQRTLTLSLAARKLASIETTPVERKFVSIETRMVGKVEYDETRLGVITARMPGRLDRLYVDFTGVSVKKGDHLVYLYSPDLFAAQEELIQALKAVESSADSTYQRYHQTTADSLEAARSKLTLWGLTDEQVEEIETRGTASQHMTIYAPMGGVVIKKHAVEGKYVATGDPIYTIADLSRVWVKLDAYESDLGRLRYGQRVEFVSEAYPGETFHGTIAFIDPVLDTRTRTVKVRVNVTNKDGRLKPGMFVRAIVRAKIATGGRVVDAALAGKWISPMHPEIVKDGPGTCDVCGMALVPAESLGFLSADAPNAKAPLVIPISAPLRTGKRAVVYVADPQEEGKYEGREIVLGPRAGEYYLVLKGLAEGERVVTRGNFKIDSAMQIQSRTSMMNPKGTAAQPVHSHEHHTGDH